MSASDRIVYDLLLERARKRWYPLYDHPVQLALVKAVDDGVRFPIVPAGRRSGKTERAKRFLCKRAMYLPNKNFFAGAPTREQAKKIWWNDLKDLSFSCKHVKKPSETDLQIFFPNGTTLHVLGFDEPARFEGTPWHGGVIDEIANVKEKAINENIMPALDTVNPMDPHYRAWCWFIGVPEGLGKYKEMADLGWSKMDPNYRTFHWKSADILPQDVIDGLRRIMSPKQFRQELEASFETAGGRIYEDFNKENYFGATAYSTEPLHWMHDQNFTPLSSAIVVMRDEKIFIVDEVVLTSAISRQSAEEFVSKYENHENKMVYIYGDPAGLAGTKHGHKSDYDDIEEVLRMNNWKYERRVRNKHPAIKDRQNSVRAMVCNAKGERRLFVNPEKAPWSKRGLSDVQLKEGSSFQEDDSNEVQHITTAIGYFCDYLWPSGQVAIKGGSVTGNF